jgi:hypothetical protein
MYLMIEVLHSEKLEQFEHHSIRKKKILDKKYEINSSPFVFTIFVFFCFCFRQVTNVMILTINRRHIQITELNVFKKTQTEQCGFPKQ